MVCVVCVCGLNACVYSVIWVCVLYNLGITYRTPYAVYVNKL